MEKNKVGIIGSGMVAQVLGNGFLKHGFEVMIGTRDKQKLENWLAAAGDKASVGSFSEAAGFGEIIVLAVKGIHALKVIESAGKENFEGKTIIDVNNPIAEEPPINGVLKFYTGPGESLLEQLQSAVPAGNFVKAFSCVGAASMVNPYFEEGTPTMFICGNNADAKADVKHILDLFGWDTMDLGLQESARAIEPLCMLWCIPGFQSNSWNHAFKMLRK